MDTYSYKGWLNSDNFWKRAFAIVGYTYAVIFAVWVALICFALGYGIVSAIISTFSGGGY